MIAPSTPNTTVQTLKGIVDPFGVYCVLELRFPSDSHSPYNGSIFHVFPVMPESMRIAQRYLQTITPTQGGVFVDEFGRAPSPITLQGTFGRSPNIDIREAVDSLVKNADALRIPDPGILGTGPNFAGADAKFSGGNKNNGGPVTGYKLVRLLSQMVEWSHEPFGQSAKCPQVFFYNFAFGQFHEVALNSFQAQMTVEANGLWTYQIEMTTLRQLGSDLQAITRNASADKVLNFLLASPPTPETAEPNRLQNLFNKIQNVRNIVLDAANRVNRFTVRDLIEKGLGALDKALKLTPGTLTQFYDSVRSLPFIINQASRVLSTPSRLWTDLETEVNTVRNSISSAASEFGAQWDFYVKNLDGFNQKPFTAALTTAVPLDSASWNGDLPPETEDLHVLMGLMEDAANAEDALRQIDVLAEIRGLASAAPTNPASAAPDEFTAVASANGEDYQIRQGDTLTSIALATYGSADSWPLVAQNLPQAMRGLSPNQPLDAYVGQAITVSASTNDAVDLVPYVWDTPVGLDSLGRDLPSEFRVQQRSDGTAALDTLSEQSTLLQGIAQRISLPFGASPDTPSFGSTMYSMVGQSFGVLQSEMNRAFVEEAVTRDPRIAEVSYVNVAQTGDTYTVQFSALAVNNVRLESEELVIASS